jgi:CheY-like chemotaxis protein/AraC-like DNA-binding protein
VQDGANAARPTVLAVDDEPTVRYALGLVLDDHCDLLLAPDGPSALDLLNSHRVDVVLLDLLMPNMHGLDVLPRLLAADPTLIVVVLTAVAAAATVVRAMKLGAWHYVTKPWENDELVGLVQQAARERKATARVLIISDDPATFGPLQLALERQVRISTIGIAHAATYGFPANVVVLEPRAAAADADAASVREYFPHASVFVLTDKPYRLDQVVAAVLRRAGVPGTPTALPEPVANAIAFMVGHYHEHLVVRDLARIVALSEDRLHHVFKEATGFAVKDYFTRLRIAIACRFLTETNAKIDIVAQRVGFADGSSLSRTFIDLEGVRPGEFRRSMQGVRPSSG